MSKHIEPEKFSLGLLMRSTPIWFAVPGNPNEIIPKSPLVNKYLETNSRFIPNSYFHPGVTTMSGCDSYIERLNMILPSLATTQDLVNAGIYGSAQSAYAARRIGKCPGYFRIPCRGIVYPKAGVIDFVKAHATE